MQLELQPQGLRAPDFGAPAVCSWLARLTHARLPHSGTEATQTAGLRLSRQLAACGNMRAASALLDQARKSEQVAQSPSGLALASMLGCELSFLQGSYALACGGLDALISDPVTVQALKGHQLALLLRTSASWQEKSSGPTAPLAELLELGEDYQELAHVSSAKECKQLGLLLRATHIDTDTAHSWASLSNWLHTQLAEGQLKVTLSIRYRNLTLPSALLSGYC